MALLVTLTLAGLIVGAATLGDAWFFGALSGFLLARVLQLSERLQALEQQLMQWRSAAQPQAAAPPVVPQQGRAEQTPSRAASPAAPGAAMQTAQASPAGGSRASASASSASAAHQSADPSALERSVARGLKLLRRFFTEGNPIVRVGMVVTFFGLSFLAKYASSAGLFPIELRLACVALVAIALLALGWKTRERNGYGLVLQGGGVAALYLTLFAAGKLYTLMPTALALALMLLVVMLGVMLAVLQNAQVLAVMATAGGFLAPILTSNGSGNYLGLFSFYLLLNVGVLSVAWFKSWRLLNWIGFVFTFGISSSWLAFDYQAALYPSVQPFMLAFFVFYLLVSLLFSIKQPPRLKGLVDGSLVFGLPTVAFAIQAVLLEHSDYGLALSALGMAAIYLALCFWLWSRYREQLRFLIESFIAVALAFATLAVPLALDAQWTSATWALEACGLLWVGLRQQRLLPRLAAYGLYAAAVLSQFAAGAFDTGTSPIISGDFLGLALLGLAAFGLGLLLQRYPQSSGRLEAKLEAVAIVLGACWWLSAGLNELGAFLSTEAFFAAGLIFVAISLLGAMLTADRLRWPGLARLGYALLPIAFWWYLVHGLGSLLGEDLHPSAGWGGLALLVFVGSQYYFLWRQGTTRLVSAYHLASAWLLLALLCWETAYWQDRLAWSGTWAALLWFASFTLPVIALMAFVERPHWPFAPLRRSYKIWLPMPMLGLLLLWFVAACSLAGSTGQLHLPILNPLDLAQFAAVLLLGYCMRQQLAGLGAALPEWRYSLLGLAAFVWLNVVVLRAVHHYSGVDYQAQALWASATLQMALSILWSTCALVVMNLARRRQLRSLWLVGAALLALVLLKLFTKDLTGSGSLARIVSFMVVGALMLLIGYLSPMPAAAGAPAANKPLGKEGAA